MLLRFAIENFMSFKNSTEFRMNAGKITRHSDHCITKKNKRILKGAFLFGANASGKSNFIRAIDFVRSIVFIGLKETICEKKFFRIDSSYKYKPGIFQIDFFQNNNFYSYGFAISYTNLSIEEEWLYKLKDNNDDFCVFLRTKLENGETDIISDIKFNDKIQIERFNVYCEDIKSKKMNQTLFLSDIVLRSPDDNDEYQPFRDAFEWLKKIIIVFPESKYGDILRLLDNNDERAQLAVLLKHFDTGIDDVSKQKLEFDKAFDDFPEEVKKIIKSNMIKEASQNTNYNAQIRKDSSLIEVNLENGDLLASKIQTNHGNNSDLFDFNDESDGTQRLFDLLPLFQSALGPHIIFIDELDRSLHTKATQEFISYFYELTKDIDSQLIATTHDSNILNLNYLRQDEIWFVERNKDHSSQLYSLNKFKARFDKDIEKDYLLGRYGAIPFFEQNLELNQSVKEGEYNG